MELRTCVYCGTEYNKDETKCPLCGGGSSQESLEEAEGAKKHRGSPKRRRAKSGPWGVISIILGLLVIGGIVMFFLHMDFFREGGFDFNAIPTKLPEYSYEQQQPEQEPQPEAEQPPAVDVVQPEVPVVSDPNSKTCTGLTISQTEVVMDEAGGRIFLTAVARPSDCQDPIVFRSSDESVATITENGMITAIGPGTAEITVICGLITKVCVVECVFQPEEELPEEEPPAEEEPEEEVPQEPADPNAPALNNVDFTLFTPGEEFTLTVKNAPAGAAVSFVSSNTGVVTVDAGGKVVAKGDGTATITVTVGDVTLTAIARCNLDTASEGTEEITYTGPFTISHEDVTLSRKGEEFTLSLKDANGNKVTGLTWSASNSAASVSGSTVKAMIAGQTLVSCVYDGKTYSCIVRCIF